MKELRGTAVIIGAGPAGLTAALELLRRAKVKPIVLEKSGYMGGISRTVNYKGNRIDIGGHRFFSKSDRVMHWWTEVMPVEDTADVSHRLTYQNRERTLAATGKKGPDPQSEDLVLLVRPRQSRILFLRKLFEYPLKLTPVTLRQLGLLRTFRAGISYLRSSIRPIPNEKTLEDFLINRFGRQLYQTFFKSYTEKVWGVPCHQISAEWGAQRIKGLSLRTAILHHLRKLFGRGSKDIAQKDTETSLIEKFLYPKFGPGQLWEEVARRVCAEGGEILTGWNVARIHASGNRVTGVTAVNERGGERHFPADHVFSTMPVKELIHALDVEVPHEVREVSDGLIYRDFITVGLLLDRLRLGEKGRKNSEPLKDNWIYIQEHDVLVGRMQIFNNWSPFMVQDPAKVWVGFEYFCYDTDDLWKKPDREMIELAIEEAERTGIFSKGDVVDATVIRMEKTYPAYFGSYDRFDVIRGFVDGFHNLFLVGRNGMHKYNNQDHSMLTAMTAVDNIIAGRHDKSNIWAVNTEMEYHESKDGSATRPAEDSSRSGVVRAPVVHTVRESSQ
ncbi:MAG: NAD(P)/FAD-dependent oxidoreductase [Bryobacterales bacterium]|nr:NAD(P)/FAD-dependent oxidoreductase [Bryobacterales bacterium]MEB2363742.1 NAD(P)/FAD-dependent oxidoreductase [Bryobacterales bacterium]